MRNNKKEIPDIEQSFRQLMKEKLQEESPPFLKQRIFNAIDKIETNSFGYKFKLWFTNKLIFVNKPVLATGLALFLFVVIVLPVSFFIFKNTHNATIKISEDKKVEKHLLHCRLCRAKAIKIAILHIKELKDTQTPYEHIENCKFCRDMIIQGVRAHITRISEKITKIKRYVLNSTASLLL